ncbi:MAG TPA: MBL fold metallo-hydrolase [Desulfobacteraceae bacterium]|nr:MBL fold metallo-hydrolase [Desulfobacteraceae bacterium]
MHRIMSGPYHLNTYVLVCEDTCQCLIIDPGGRAEDLAQYLNSRGLTPALVLLTHGHADQFFVCESFKMIWNIPYCLHRADDEFFRDPDVRTAIRNAVGLPPPHPADRPLDHGDQLRFGNQTASFIHTPGHTPGSSCILWKNRLFTGDTLFVGEAGRTDLPGGDLNTMISSIRDRILPLPPQTLIFPGHHHPGTAESTNLEREMAENIYITDFILDP